MADAILVLLDNGLFTAVFLLIAELWIGDEISSVRIWARVGELLIPFLSFDVD